MPNAIGPTGLTVATRAELFAALSAAMRAVYGDDINLASDSPDGQLLNIFIQTVLDTEDLLVQINNQFDPDNAIGAILDQRVAINGIQRQAGTFTITNVTITVSQALNLAGLDQTTEEVYTVQDNAGNKWQLQISQTLAAPGAYVMSFQAQLPGAVLTVPNTITVPVTVVLGVTAINNPTVYTSLGINEESDATLKIRRQQSVSLSSQGYYAGLLAALKNINGVTSAFIYENTDSITDINGVPGHSIWVIVAGSGAAADIANAIYTKRNAGCGLFGSITYTIIQVDNSPFVVRWDGVVEEDLYIKFTASSLDGVNPPNIALILSNTVGLPFLFVPGVNEQVNINDLATLVQQIDNNTLVTASGFGLTSGGSFFNTLSPSARNKQFQVAQARIIITPMQMSGPGVLAAYVIGVLTFTASVAVTDTLQLASVGGFGGYTYSMSASPSGGSVDPSTGLYTAGATPSVVDIVLVTDALSNTAQISISVTA